MPHLLERTSRRRLALTRLLDERISSPLMLLPYDLASLAVLHKNEQKCSGCVTWSALAVAVQLAQNFGDRRCYTCSRVRGILTAASWHRDGGVDISYDVGTLGCTFNLLKKTIKTITFGESRKGTTTIAILAPRALPSLSRGLPRFALVSLSMILQAFRRRISRR